MRADHIGAYEVVRTQDRAIHMRLGRKVHERVDAMPLEQPADGILVADIPAHELEARVPFEAGETFDVARVGKRVQHDDLALGRAAQPIAHEVRADESRSPGDEDVMRLVTHPTSFSGCGANAAPVRRQRRVSPWYRAR